jgi:hypothetical protein
VPSWQCFTSTHLAFCIVGAATILCFSVFSFVGAWSRGAGTLYQTCTGRAEAKGHACSG